MTRRGDHMAGPRGNDGVASDTASTPPRRPRRDGGAPIHISSGNPGIVRPDAAQGYAVDLAALEELRHAVIRDGQRFGLTEGPLNDLVLIANELATNVVRHGGGVGRMWLWHLDGCVYCQVTDGGPGMHGAHRAGEKPRDPNALTGRGLWLIRQMSHRVHVETNAHGTTVTVTIEA
jgi:anti-sigma regulatory factor (Ser/Thr protein kinase)